MHFNYGADGRPLAAIANEEDEADEEDEDDSGPRLSPSRDVFLRLAVGELPSTSPLSSALERRLLQKRSIIVTLRKF